MPEEPWPTLVVGLGCQRDCPASEMLELIQQSLAGSQWQLTDLSALASIDLKRDERGLLELAELLRLPLRFFSAAQLAPFESRLSHRSPVAFEHTGCHGVAESAALALASQSGLSPARLLIPRKTSTQATFALASASPDRR
jgi:cobalt-precorrin 5A hydrolase